MEATKKEVLPNQFRLKFDQEDVEFMNFYKQEYGASIQWFVEKAVKLRIQELKVKLDLGEI